MNPVKTLNGNGVKVWVQGLMVVLQTILTIIGLQIYGFMKDHQDRIVELEKFQAAGDRWTASDQMRHESAVARETLAIWKAIEQIRNSN